MANRRTLKKEVKSATNLLIEDAYLEAMDADEKEKKKMNGIINDIVDDRYDFLSRISSYPKSKDRTKVKEHFNAIHTDLETKTADYSKQIARIS